LAGFGAPGFGAAGLWPWQAMQVASSAGAAAGAVAPRAMPAIATTIRADLILGQFIGALPSFEN
jgi:hypothetical protein